MATITVSFSNGFVGDYSKNNEAINADYLSAYGWSNFQFRQSTDNGQFGGSQGNDYSGTILITDANGVQHAIDGVINWRAPSGAVSTVVFYATGASQSLATSSGTYLIDPFTGANGDPHTFIGLTFNGQSLSISGGKVTGNAATAGLLSTMNTYLGAQPQLSIGDVVVDEAAGMATVTVSLSKVSSDTVTVKYATADGSASAGSDYGSASGTLSFSPGETSKTIQVSILNDTAAELTENFSVILSDSSFAAITDNSATVQITDNDAAAIAVSNVLAEDAANTGATPTDSTVTEGASLRYTVTLNAAGGSVAELTLALGGSAGAGDYGSFSFNNGVAWKNGDPASGVIVVPAGVAGFTITVPTSDDAAIENTETLILTVGGVAATGTITDNDSQSVSSVLAEDAAHTGATPVDSSVVEGDSLSYTVTLSAAGIAATEYSLAISGTAAAADYASISFSDGVAWKNGDPQSGTIVVPAGITGFRITVVTTDDAAIESAESLTLTVGGVASTGTITDNDSQSVSSVLAEDAAHTGANPVDSSVVEGGSLSYSVMLNAAGIAASEYNLAIGGTAAAADYASVSFSDGVAWKNGDPQTGVIVVPAGIVSFRVTVATVDDAAIESAESLTLTVGGVASTGTITDNDSQSVSGVLAEDAANTGANPIDNSVVEGDSLSYTVTLSAAGIAASEYNLAISGTAVAADYGSLSFSDGVAWKNGDPQTGVIVVPAGIGSFRITVSTTDDSAIESAESLVLTVGGVAGSATITDNDSQSVSSVLAEDAANTGAHPADSSVVEGGTLSYTVSLNAAGIAASEYSLAISGTAAAADYASISFSDGVAWKNGDPQSGVIVVPAGIASFRISVATTDDALIESAESLILTVGGVSGSGTITDNDSQSVSSVLAEDAGNAGANPVDSSVIEGASLRYTVALNAAAPSGTEHTLGVGGTAAAADYGSFSFSDGVAWKNGNPASGIIVVPAGVSSFAITVATTDDTAVELAESLTLTVGGVAATGTISDNDSLSVSSVVAEDAAHTGAVPSDDSVVEGASLLYSVILNASSPQATEFTLAAGGTAAAADYGSFSFSNGVAWKNGDPQSGVIVVPANVGSFTITVPTIDDSQIEAAESLVLNVGGVSASGTLTDNDSQNVASVLAEDAAHPGANPPDSSVVEGGGLRYSVALTQASPAATEYALAASGTASAADYGAFSFSNGVAWKNGDPASGVIVIPAGVASFAINVATVDDSAIELAESLVLTVGGVSASATITDNDSQSVVSVTAQDAGHLGANDSTVEEGGTLLYTVLLNGASPASTSYAISVHGTAAAADYGSFVFSNGVAWQGGNPASGVLVVPANVSGFTITVPTLDDTALESTESLVLTVGGVSAGGSIVDNDQPPPTPPNNPPTGPIDAGLDPNSDNGSSPSDTVTSVITPEFTVRASGYLQSGGSIRLIDPAGKQVGSSAIGAADAVAGTVNVQTGQLDDGVYTFTAQIFDAAGKLLGSAPVKVTVVTDVDGIAPSVELAANGGDFNRDGIADWQQHNVAQLPMASLAEFQAGRGAAASSFGAIMAGTVSAANAGGAVQLTGNAQLADLSLSAAPAPLPSDTRAASAMFNFTVGARPDSGALPDLDASRPGLQTRVVLDLAPGGVTANTYLKWNAQSQSWFSFLDDQRLDTNDDGATLLDLNGDGKIDRIVLTLTDGGPGDEDGLVNGVVVDPGLLAFQSAPKPPEPPPAKPVFSVLLQNGDRYYSADAADAARMAQGEGARLEGAYFDSLDSAAGGRPLLPSFQPFTVDWYFAAAGQAQPYACYVAQAGAGFQAAAPGAAGLTEFRLYQNQLGQTQLFSAAQAASLGLAAQGYVDRGAQFSTTTAGAFSFDAEGYLVANRQNAGVQALVASLAQSFGSTSAAGFVEAVEQHYLGQVQLVGLAAGAAASAADLNAAFGTHFNA